MYGNYNKCLDADASIGGANGTRIQVYDCNGGVNQQWVMRADGSIVSAASGRCLDAVAEGTANGTALQLYDCTGGANQHWVGGATPNGGDGIQGVGSGRCLDIPGASITLGTQPQLYDCLGDAQQQWIYNGSTVQVYSDKCLDVAGDGIANGTLVQIWYCSGAEQQQWTWGSDGEIRSNVSGRCLDAIAAGTSNGTNLQIWDCNGTPNQLWQHRTPAVTTASLPGAQVGSGYSVPLASAGGIAPYTWSVSSGSLPAGLTLSPAGILAGTPTAPGQATFTVQVTDASTAALSGTRTFVLNVGAASVSNVPPATSTAPPATSTTAPPTSTAPPGTAKVPAAACVVPTVTRAARLAAAKARLTVAGCTVAGVVTPKARKGYRAAVGFYAIRTTHKVRTRLHGKVTTLTVVRYVHLEAKHRLAHGAKVWVVQVQVNG